VNREHPIDALGAFADGALEAVEHAAVEAHLTSCTACRQALDELQALDAALASTPVPDPGPQYWSRFATRVAERTRPASNPGRIYERLTGWLFSGGQFAWPRAVGALAACTLVVYFGLRGFHPAEKALREASTPVPAGRDTTVDRIGVPSREPAVGAPGVASPRLPHLGDSKKQSAPQRGAARTDAADQGTVKESTPVFRDEKTVTQAKAGKDVARKPDAQPPAAIEAGPAYELAPVKPNAAEKSSADEPQKAPSLRDIVPPPVPPLHVRGGRSTETSLQAAAGADSLATVDSMLALQARLWPQRDEAAVRERLSRLSLELSRYPEDARARAQARTLFEWLAATSADDSTRLYWRTLLRNSEER
jgi:hypothetical protein